MSRWRAVFGTLFLVVAYDGVVHGLFPSADPVTFFSVLLGSLCSLSFWLFWSEVRELLPRAGQWVLAVAISGFLSVLLAVNLFTFWKLGDFVNAYMLMFVSVDKGFVWDQLRLYALNWKSLGLVPSFLAFLMLWKPMKQATLADVPKKAAGRIQKIWLKKSGWCLIWAAFFVVVLNQVKYETVGQHKWVDTSFFLALKNYQKSTRLNVLRSSVRASVAKMPARQRPDVFLFVGESFGKQFLKLYGFERNSSPVLQDVFSSGSSVVFQHALSNSSCTDVSLPALFSGVGPEESDVKLHEMPLIWDWLRAAGYHTIFASPQKFAFANFDAFILSPGPDAYLSADRFMSLGSFIAHNNGLDDIWAAKATAEKIEKAPRNRPLLLIFFTNATHYPFLQKSTELQEQPQFPHPYENSLWIEDQAFKVLWEAFAKHRDLNRLLAFTSADHGELEVHTRPVPRIASFYDEILSIPFAFRLPVEEGLVKGGCLEGLRKNSKALVQNLDVLPTILDLLGFADSDAHRALVEKLQGHSLCREVGDQRVIVSLNTNNIRQWNPEGFLLAKDSQRLVFTNSEGLRYFSVDRDPEEKNDLFPNLPSGLLEEFDQKINSNLQLTRIKNLYFPEGLLKYKHP